MSTYLKNIARYKHGHLKSKTYDEIQKLFDKEMKRVNTFVDMNLEVVKGDEHVEVEKNDQEEAEMKRHIEIVKDDKVAIDAIPLATKPPVIGIDKENLEILWKLVKAKHENTRLEEDYERVLWGDLKVMFEPDIKSDVWRSLQGYKICSLGSTTPLRSAVVIPSSGNQGGSSTAPAAEGSNTQDSQGKGIMVDDATAPSGGASRSRPSFGPAPSFKDVSGDAIHMDFFPFSAGPCHATYPKGGIAGNCEFTHGEWDAPYRLTFGVLTKEVFKDPAIYKTVVDQFPTPGEMVRVKSLSDDQMTVKMSVLHCMMMSRGGELLARYHGLNQSHYEYVLSADSRLKGYEEKVANMTGLELQVVVLKKQVPGLNDKLTSFDASFSNSKAKGKERKKKIKSLGKSLDNLHAEVARLLAALNQATILEAERDDEILRRVQGELLSLAASVGFEHGLSMHQAKDEFAVVLKKMISKDARVSPPVAKELIMTSASKSLELSANVDLTPSVVASEHNKEMVNAEVDGSDPQMIDDTITAKSEHAFMQDVLLSIQRILSHATRPNPNGFPPRTFSIADQAFVGSMGCIFLSEVDIILSCLALELAWLLVFPSSLVGALSLYDVVVHRSYSPKRRGPLPNGDALRKCILKCTYTPTTVVVPAVPAIENSPKIPAQTTVKTVLNMSPENKAYFESEKEAIHLILTGIGDEIYSTVDVCQTAHEMWEAIERLQQVNELRAERMAKNANPLALVVAAQTYPYPYYQSPKSHKSYTPTSKASLPTKSHATTRYKGKEIDKPITPPSESASEEDSDPEQAQKDKEMQKNLALIAKYFKKLYKPTNNNLRTSSNTRNKNVETTPRYKNDNQIGQFRNQRAVNVARARETVGGPVVQQSGIQCFNCKEFGHYAKECRKPKWVKDSTYHKEKMLLCKQAEKGVQLQAEQSD
ncbi:integrase, catalytic region, zinc finger, CCHC-type containing protein [Tanacetum coccineum]